MKYKLKVHTINEIGQRDNQEDSIFPLNGKATEDDRLFILCDGMGGHEAGEVASQTVCEAMSKYILEKCKDPEGEFNDEDLLGAVNAAFEALDGKVQKDVPQSKKMGTTMTCLKLHSKGCTIAHIGDSRVYHIRPSKSKEDMILHQTEDHSLINDLIKIGEMTVEEAKLSNQKNVITRAMQPNMERPPKPDIYHSEDIEAGDYFYLCSDGMLEQEEWDNTYIRNNFLEFADQDKELAGRLWDITTKDKENGSKDNHSAIIVHIIEVKKDVKEDILQNDQTIVATEIEMAKVEKEVSPKNQEKAEEGKVTVTGEHMGFLSRLKNWLFKFMSTIEVVPDTNQGVEYETDKENGSSSDDNAADGSDALCIHSERGQENLHEDEK